MRQNNNKGLIIWLKLLSLFQLWISAYSISNCQTVNAANSSLCDVCYSGYIRTTSLLNCGQQILNCQFLNDASTYQFSNVSYTYESTSGTNLILADDQTKNNISLGFTFNYWGVDYSVASISMNGFILFEASAIINMNKMDLYPISGYYVKYQTTGQVPYRKFILSYHVGYYACRTSTTLFTDFQVVLYETSNLIRINVQSYPSCNGLSSIQGIINQDGTNQIYTPNRNKTFWGGTYNSSVQFNPIFILCETCITGYFLKNSTNECLPQKFIHCLFYLKENEIYKCRLCDIIKKFQLITETVGCECKDGYFQDLSLNGCKQICGDGIRIQYECDDNNTINGDGCNNQCQIQIGFHCDTSINPTNCNSTQKLNYQIESIAKTDNQPSAIIALKPTNKLMLFNISDKNFFTNNNQLTQLGIKIIVGEFPNQNTVDVQFHLVKVENNQIYLLFHYNFTVEGLNATITLNYSETRYLNSTQQLNFTLIGDNDALKFTSFQEAFNNVSNYFITTMVLIMLELLIGLFLPKFIGLQTLITLQLIFYSQLLIGEFKFWPIGFDQFNNLKISTGYNAFIKLSNFYPLTDMSKKYNKLTLHKTIIENFNLSFVILVIPTAVFFVSIFIRQKQENKLKEMIRQNKQQQDLIILNKNRNRINKINEIIYRIVSQLSIWCILPLMSALGGQFMIKNNQVTVINQSLNLLLLDIRGMQFTISFTIVFFIGLNHFKNAFLSLKSMKKINERPQELLYKKLLFGYLFIMGVLIFFMNDKQIHGIYVSALCLVIQLIYSIVFLKIQPYQQSLRVHAIALYLNQILYTAFLVLINLINFTGQLSDFIILCAGYLIVGGSYLLILLTFIRLYYEIRYGEALQLKIKEEKQKKKKKQKNLQEETLQRKINKLQNEAKKRIDEKQKERDLNQYLMETQQKQLQKTDLLQWLQNKNWQKQAKQKYFYQKFDQKPVNYKKKNKNKREEENNQSQERKLLKQKQLVEKKKKREQDPQYIDVTDRLKKSLQEKKQKKKSLKSKKPKQVNQIEQF